MRPEADNKSWSAGVVFAALLAAPLLFAASLAKAHVLLPDYDAHYHFEIKLSSDTIAENSGDTITVTANCTSAECRQLFAHPDPATNQGAYIDIFIVGGELQAGGAVLSANKRLTFTTGNTVDLPRMSSGTVTIRVTDDGLSNGDRKVTITGSVPYHPSRGSDYWYSTSDATPVVTSATLTVQDDEPPAATLALGENSINESGAGNSTTVEARLSRAVTTATTITLAAPAGTSLSGTTLTIDAGDTSSADAATAAHRQVTLTAVDNTTDAPDRMVSVTGTSSLTGEPPPLIASLTIADDDDAPTVTLAAADSSISENGGTSAVSATLSHPSSEATTVTVQAASGLYTVGSDATITIAAGDTTNSSDTVSITAVNNTKDEPHRSVTVTGTAQNSQGAGAVSGAALTITDDDATPTVTLAVADTTIEESSGTASETMTTVSATLSNPSSEATTITVTPVLGAYAVGADATITIAAGETANSSDTASITAVDNDIDVGASRIVTVTASARNSQGVGMVTGAPLTITDDDEAGLTVSKNSVATTEAAGDGRTDTFTVHLASEPTAAVTVTIGVTGGDTDEATVSPATLKFAATANSGNNEFKWDDPQTVTVTGVDENVQDSDRSYTITVAAASGDAIYNDNTKVPDKTLSGLNVDDDASRVTLVLGSTSLNESGAGNSTTISARLSQASTDSTAITLTAPAGTSLDATRLTIDAGETSSADADTTAHRQVTLTAVDNTTDAPNRMVSVTGSASNAAVVADPAPVSLTIADDDNAPTVTLSLSSASLSENGGTATVSATLSNPSSEATTVTVQAASGLYTVGADATITIAAGETANSSDTASIAAVNNAKDEPNRSGTVTASAQNSQGVGMVTGAPLTIADDDAAPTVTLSLSNPSISENGGTATVSATLSNPSSEATTVTVAAVSGAYAVGADATITIAAGETENSSDTASITAVDDGIDVGASRIVTVTGTAQNSRGAGAVTGAALTITDDDEAGLTVSKNSVATTEAAGGGRTDTFTVQLDTEPTATVTVTIGVTGGDTDEAMVNPQTLKFAAMANSGNNEFKWDDPQQVTVTGQDDSVSDGDRSYTITVAAASGDAIYNDNAKVPDETVSGSNADDDAPKVTLALGSTSINESGTGNSTTVSARLSRASTAPTAITLTAPAGTSLDATRLTIDAGETSSADADTAAHRQVTLTAVDNDVDAADRMVSVTGSASNAVAVADPAPVSLTIADDDTAGLTVSKSSVSTSEPNGRDSFTVQLDTEPTATVTVTIGVTGGDTDEATVSPTTLKFAAEANSGNNEFKWDDPRQVTVTGQDDTASDGDRSYTITMAAASADANYNALSKTVSGLNADDDVPRVTLVLSKTEIAESGEFNSTTITAFLDRVSTAPTTIKVTAPPGTTLSDTRMGETLLTLDTLTIDADEFSSSSADTAAHRQLTLRAVDNGFDAPDRVVTVTGTATNSAVVSGPAGVSLTITDDDDTPGLEATTVRLPLRTSEAAGPPVSIRVRLQSEPTATVTLSIRSSDTSEATVTPSTLKFAAVADIRDLDDPVYEWNVRREVTVRGVDDLEDDNHQPFAITMTAASADTRYHGQSLRMSGVNLDDDDPEVKLSLSDDSISENGGTTEVSAALTEVSHQTVTITFSDATDAYTVPPDANTITIEAGETKSADRVTLTAVDNTTDSPDRSGTVRGISSPQAEVVGAELTLEDDDDAPTVTLAVADNTIKENSGTASETMTTVSATLSHASSEDTTITVTAVPGAYTVGSDATITIAAGETENSSDTVSITAVNNTWDEPDRSVTVTGSAANSHEAGSVTGASLTITDDDPTPSITLTVDDSSVGESDGATLITVTATVDGTTRFAEATTVTVSVAGSGTAGAVDFAAVADFDIEIAAEAASDNDTFTLTPTNDALDETDETITVSGSSGSLTVNSATITLADDDATPSLSIDSPIVAEGNAGAKDMTFTVTLSAASGRQVTVDYAVDSTDPGTATSGTDYAPVSSGTLTFAAGTTSQTVTVSVTGDAVEEPDKTVRLTLSGPTNATLGTAATGVGTIVDDDGTSLIVLDADPTTANVADPGPLALKELSTDSANSKSYSVRLATPPTQTATVTITSGDTGAVTVNDTDGDNTNGVQNTLTFTAQNWSAARTVTLTAAEDDDGADESVAVTHAASTASNSEYTGESASLTATVDDDETPAVVIDADPSTANVDEAGPLTLTEGHASNAAKTYSVRLATEPTQTVTVTLTSADTGAVSIDDTDGDNSNGVQNTLTFTSSTWETAQTVTARAANDDDATDESAALGAAASTATTSEYTGVTASLAAAVDDDETRAVTLGAATLSVPENGSAMYTAKLAAQPVGGNVTVTITGAGSGITANPTTLTFTTTNWSAARTVTVSAASDANTANEVVTLTHTPTGADYGGGAGVAAEIVATATDDDTPSLRVSPTMLTVAEGGSAAYQVRLNTQPSANVTVTVGGATTEVTVDTDDDATGNQTTLAFTTTDWGTDQEVKVSAAADDDATNETLTLGHTANGGDYTGLDSSARPSVAVTVEDDDTPTIVIDADPSTTNVDETGPLALNELSTDPANSKSYTVRLATEPTTAVTVGITSGDRAVSVDTDMTPRTRTLAFTTTNWSSPQTVTATAAQDDDASNETVTIAHSATGGDYQEVKASLTVTTVDDDEPKLVVDASALTAAGLAEGASGTYTVRLATEPTGPVRVSVSVSGGVSVDADGDQAGDQGSLRFDGADWNVPKAVRVRALRDADAAAGTAALGHSASRSDYGGVSAPAFSFEVRDGDAPGLAVSASTLSVPESGSAAYTVKLDTQPVGGDVTVTITGAGGGLTASPTTLTFTATTWSAARTVTVSASDDLNTTNESVTLTHTPTGADYDGVAAAAELVATVTDDDTQSLRVSPTMLTVEEGSGAAYRVRLNTQPSADVTVTVGGATTEVTVDTDGDAIGNQTTLAFTTTDWGTDREVRVSAADDDDATNETLTLSHAANGGDYTGLAVGAPRPSVAVTVEDDDAPGFAFAPAGGLSLSEPAPGIDPATSSGTYAVRLATQPTGSVTVEVSSDDAGVEVDTDGTPRTLTLTFDGSNWDTPQSVAVRAVADADAVSETASLRHATSGGGYGGVSASLPVRVLDDTPADPPPPPPPSPPSPPPPANQPPRAVGSLPDLELDVGESASLDLGDLFADDGPLTHQAESSDPSVASARVSDDAALRVEGLSAGLATVTVTATDRGGLSARRSFRASVGRVLSFAAPSASAPEGGVLRLALALSRPASAALSVAWTARPDGDPATADADAADLGSLRGTAAFAPGGTEALVEIPVRDDGDIEPAREFLTAALAAPPTGAGWALGRLSEATLAVQEGVCDRSPAVRDALRGSRACWAPTPAELAGRGYLSLHRKGIAALRPKDLLGLSGLRVLHLHGNRLAALPEGLFAGLGALERLRLDGNRLAELPAGLLAGAPRLSLLDLGGNRIESLPAGLFAGVAGLAELNLSGNPGAPFPLVVRLARTDAESWAPGPARVEARVAEGAPFPLSAALLAQGAELSATQASVPAGATAGPPLQAAQAGPGAARLSLAADPAVPDDVCGDVQDGQYPCFRGLAPQAGPPLVLFKPPPRPTGQPPAPALSANGDRASLALDGLFDPAEAGGRLAYAARSHRPDLLAVRIADGRLVLDANEDGLEGTAIVTVTATDPDGLSASLTLTVTVEFAPTATPNWRLQWMRTLGEASQ